MIAIHCTNFNAFKIIHYCNKINISNSKCEETKLKMAPSIDELYQATKKNLNKNKLKFNVLNVNRKLEIERGIIIFMEAKI